MQGLLSVCMQGCAFIGLCSRQSTPGLPAPLLPTARISKLYHGKSVALWNSNVRYAVYITSAALAFLAKTTALERLCCSRHAKSSFVLLVGGHPHGPGLRRKWGIWKPWAWEEAPNRDAVCRMGVLETVSWVNSSSCVSSTLTLTGNLPRFPPCEDLNPCSLVWTCLAPHNISD